MEKFAFFDYYFLSDCRISNIFFALRSFWMSSTDRLSFLLSAETIPNDFFSSVFRAAVTSASVPIR